MRILDNRTTPNNRTIFNFPVGNPINQLLLLYILTQLSRRDSYLTSLPDSISQANKIASEKSSEKKIVCLYLPKECRHQVPLKHLGNLVIFYLENYSHCKRVSLTN